MAGNILFILNEEEVQLANVSPHLTLLEWLRGQPGLTGTKKMCGEGGCGCCVVSVTRKDPATGKPSTIAINSCLCPLYSVNGWSIKTVEGIGSSKTGFHPIQKAVAQYNGTQCGYCTPGFVMSMYSLQSGTAAGNCSLQEIEDNFDGNICRCTGYRPILDAMKSLSGNGVGPSSTAPDLEDLCPKLCSSCPAKKHHWIMPTRNHGDPVWYTPTSIDEVLGMLNKSGDNAKLICGNTGKGIFKEERQGINVYINIKNIPKLNEIKSSDGYVKVGACVSISELIHTLLKLKEKSSNFTHLADHLKKVANVPVRNIGSWAGNLMLTHDNANFPSDVFTIMAAIGATVSIIDSNSVQMDYSLFKFLKVNMQCSLIVSLMIPFCSEFTWFRSFKISPRAQNAHAYVNAAFQLEVDPSSNKVVNSSPSIVFAGIKEHSINISNAESFLLGRDITDIETLQGGLSILSNDVAPVSTLLAASIEYRKQLALNLFYKFYLAVLGEKADPFFRSAGVQYVRPISKGSQDFETHQTQYPVTQPMPKLTSALQASGEALYTMDMPKQNGELSAAFVLSTMAYADIVSIDTSAALAVTGAIRVITGNEIPGCNDYLNNPTYPDPVIANGYVEYAGQPVAMVIADSHSNALKMAKVVTVKYKSRGKPILSITEAIARDSFHNDDDMEVINIGNTEDALSKSDHVVSGEIHCGSQYHFHMETHVSLVVPDDDGFNVYSSTQSVCGVQSAVAGVLGIQNNRVNVSVKRVGGGYGGKLSKAAHVAAACALGAYFTGRPVRMHLELEDNMKCMGKRFPYYAKYTVGSNKDGILQGIKVDVYTDEGCCKGENAILGALPNFDNVYKCPNWYLTPKACKTHLPSNTYCRTPGRLPLTFIMESIMDHLAKTIGMDPCVVKEANMYNKGDISHVSDVKGLPLKYCNIKDLWKDVLELAEVKKRQREVEVFNKANRWRKRGMGVVPMRYGIMWTGYTTTVLVSIYESDGTVSIVHGGVEIGQGINTKVAQTAARALGVDIRNVIIKPTNALTNPNGEDTGGSVTSEMNCRAVLDACESLWKRLDPIKDSLTQDGNHVPSWLEVIKEAYENGVDLSSKGYIYGKSDYFYDYNTYGVTCAEVEMDVLTGQREILRVDILNDCGESLNPDIDVGQVEGGFVMGLGYWLTEKLTHDKDSGELLTHNTWEYKPPFSKDIPQDMRVTLLKNSSNPQGVTRSKAVSEPPMVMSCAVVFGIKRAIESARHDAGSDDVIVLSTPITVEEVQKMCLTDTKQFLF